MSNGSRVAKARDKKKLSQAQLASELKIDLKKMQEIELKGISPKDPLFKKISKVTGVAENLLS